MHKSQIEEAVRQSTSFRSTADFLGWPAHRRQHLTAIIRELGIDTSHFPGGTIFEKMVGQVYGMWEVLSYKKPKTRREKHKVTCRCVCGTIRLVRCDGLRSGRAYSCGCYHRNRDSILGSKNPAFRGVGELRAVKFGEIRKGARVRNLEFAITIEYAWQLFLDQNCKCALTGIQLSFGRLGERHETTASLDRIDNSKGYVEGNVRWLLKDVNMIRSRYDNEYFIQICNLVAKTHPRAA